MNNQDKYRRYWRKNINLVLILLSIWMIPSFILGIFLVDVLNQITIGGFPLGFWFAQQGAIYVFVVLIWIYARRMDKLDNEFKEDGDTDQ